MLLSTRVNEKNKHVQIHILNAFVELYDKK